jgi:hypothetical protein
MMLVSFGFILRPEDKKEEFRPEWKQVDKLVEKGLPKSALKIVDSIYLAVKETLNIYNIPGRLVESIAVQGRQGQKLWDTRKVKAGVYIYKLDALGTSKTGKIVIQH